MSSDQAPEEPHHRSEPALLSPASPKPIHFPTPTNIPVLNNMMDVEFNQTELHMQEPAMRNTEIRDGAWKEAEAEPEADAQEVTLDDIVKEPVESLVKQEEESAEYDPTGDTYTVTDNAHPTDALIKDETPAQDLEVNATTSSTSPIVQVEQAQEPNTTLSGDNSAASADLTSTNDTIHDSAAQQPSNISLPLNNDVLSLLNALKTASKPATPNAAAASPIVPSTEPQSATPGAEQTPSATIANPLSTSHIQAMPSVLAQGESLEAQFPTALQSQAVTTDANANTSSASKLFTDLTSSLVGLGASANADPSQGPKPTSTSPLSGRQKKLLTGEPLTDDEIPWTPEIQQKYDDFIQAEQRYVEEGRWDQFPTGSRLFVGNLNSESVTKRDIFHVFHSHGKIAQISIKTAFGFVQFLNAADCSNALRLEQGKQIRDKKIHLEISKPQKKSNKESARERRSRSPDRRGGRGHGDRQHGQDRNGHRQFRSPSPRASYRDRYDERYRRSPTPPFRGRYRRSPSPRSNTYDGLPLPMRAPHEVPDVQILLLQDLHPDFVRWVEGPFRDQGVSVAVLSLDRNLNEDAVFQRQIVEGVYAVCKLDRRSQDSAKINIHVFKRNGNNVSFEEYQSIDPSQAVSLVREAKSIQVPSMPPQYAAGPPSQPSYGSAPPQYGQQPGFPQQPFNQYPGQLPAAPPGIDMADFQRFVQSQQRGSQPPQMASAFSPQQPSFPTQQPMNYAQMQYGQPHQAHVPPQASPAIRQSSGGAQHNMQDILARLGNYNK